ncbi:hypothetical protein TNCV_78811 [Trichonephila clavipes]|nr:hypothetical protein TNCV_78811 [Trichonephila clavipes]
MITHFSFVVASFLFAFRNRPLRNDAGVHARICLFQEDRYRMCLELMTTDRTSSWIKLSNCRLLPNNQ